MPDLKPCPFCGAKARIFAGGSVWYLACWDCEAEGPAADTEADAIAAWNHRAEPHPAAADQPQPTGEGTDVILDLVEAIDAGKLDSNSLRAMAATACYDLGWSLTEALLARREKGMRPPPEGYGVPLRTNNRRNARIDCAQELLDALIYAWQAKLEEEGR